MFIKRALHVTLNKHLNETTVSAYLKAAAVVHLAIPSVCSVIDKLRKIPTIQCSMGLKQ